MNNSLIGYRFYPTKEELVNDYLKNKNLGKSWLVDHVISEINICSFEPKDLPALAKIKSEDLVWYFFSLIVYANEKKKTIKRTTSNGFWKVTGPDGTIKDKRGSKIGIKKTLVYHQGKGADGVRTPWVIHEYHITYLPPNLTTYVLCQVKYKGDHRDISYGGNDSVVSHSDIGREINTVPEAVQVDQQVEDGLNLDDLGYPLNVQEELLTLDAINPNLLQQTPEVQVDQPVEDGLDLNDFSNPLNVQEDLRPLDAIDPNTFFNYDNPNLLQQTLEVQVETPVQEGLSMDDLEMPENEQDDLPPPEAFDPNTFFNDDYLNLSPQTSYGGNYWNDLFANDEWIVEDVIPDEVIMRGNRNVNMPMKTLSGIIVDCSSVSDCRAESISLMSYEGTSSSLISSPHDSVGSSNKHFSRGSSTDSCKDLQTSADLSVSRKTWECQFTQPTVGSKKEVKRDKSRDKETSMVKTEKKSYFIIKKAREFYCKKPSHIYVMNMITGFILLVGLIGYIKF